MAQVEGSWVDTGDWAGMQDVFPGLKLEFMDRSGTWGGFKKGKIMQTYHAILPWRRMCRIWLGREFG